MTRLRCLLSMHRWGPLQEDEKGPLRVCSSCRKTKRYERDSVSRHSTTTRHESYIVASYRQDLARFRPADRGLVQRGQMIPTGRLHAVKGDATLCGLRLEALYVFPLMRFRSVSLGHHQCADCQAASWLP